MVLGDLRLCECGVGFSFGCWACLWWGGCVVWGWFVWINS